MSRELSGISERRLRPLWDAIDARKYKPALKLASTLLTKHPDSAYLLALKALVLERLEKPEEALPICRLVKSMQPADDLVLSTLQIVYQRLGFLGEATLCLENACTKFPGNLELMTALFNCHVREYNYVKQQQTAMKMYKASGEERHLMWAVCSVYLQAKEAGTNLLMLAEALINKRIESNPLQELEALLVHISLLRDQEKYEAALEIVSGSSERLFTISLDRLRLQGELLAKLHRYVDAAEIYKTILRSNSDDWASIMHLIDVSLEMSTEDGGSAQLNLSREEVDARLTNVSKFMQQLQASYSEGKRGSFLGTVEIEYRRWFLREHETDDSMSLVASILDYFKRFGYLSSFTSDVKKYICCLGGDEKERLVSNLSEACCDDDPLKLLKRKISVYQVEEITGLKDNNDSLDVLSFIIEIVQLYKDSLHLSENVDPQDSVHGEELLITAANLLVKLFIQSQDAGFLLESILLLEFGLKIRRFNCQFKIMLISLYSSVSALTLAVDWYRSLDVKNILLETASHHVLPYLLGSTEWEELDKFLTNSMKFHDDYQKEAADLTILAYKHSTYSRVLEFVELKEKLQNSHHYLQSKCESLLLSLKRAVGNIEEIETTLAKLDYGQEPLSWSTQDKLASLSFNEDFSNRPWWSPLPDENLLNGDNFHFIFTSTQKPSFSEGASKEKDDSDSKAAKVREERWRNAIAKRCAIPRLLYLAMNALAASKENSKELRELVGIYLKDSKLSYDCFGEYVSDIICGEKWFEKQASELDLDSVVSACVFWAASEVCVWYSDGQDDDDDDDGDDDVNDDVDDEKMVKCLRLVGKVIGMSLKREGGGGNVMLWRMKVISETVVWLVVAVKAWLRVVTFSPSSSKKKSRSKNKNKNGNGNGNGRKKKKKKESVLIKGVREMVLIVCGEVENLNEWMMMRLDKEKVFELLKEKRKIEEEWSGGDEEILRNIAASQTKTLSTLLGVSQSLLQILKPLC